MAEKKLTLYSRVGNYVYGIVPFIHPTNLQKLKLHGVETGGIWVENDELTGLTLRMTGSAASLRTPIFFVPFAQISFLIATIDGVALSEKAFGV